MKSPHPASSVLATLACLLVSGNAFAAPSRSVVLTDSVVPFTSDVAVLGPAPGRAPVRFEIALRLRSYTELRSRLDRGEAISAQQMQARYLPNAESQRQLRRWAAAYQLTVAPADASDLLLQVSGTAAQVRRALGTELVRVQVGGRPYIAARSAPRLPERLAKLVVGVNGLQPYLQAYRPSAYMRNIQRRQNAGEGQAPLAVQQVLTAYDAENLAATGAGQRIGILIDTFPDDADLTQFWSLNGVAQSLANIEKVNAVAPAALPAPVGEETLDVQWASAIAPQAKVRVYATGDLEYVSVDKGLQAMIRDLRGGMALNQVSISLGTCEREIPISQLKTTDQLLTTLRSYNVNIFAASGDFGSASTCSLYKGVEFFASSPNLTAVGGTTLVLDPATGKPISETGWASSGGGYSTLFKRPTWQQGGSGLLSNVLNLLRTRMVPDVALNADPLTGYQMVLAGEPTSVSGTSVGAPIWAAFTARINEARLALGKKPLGFINPLLYPLVGSANFRDIVSGSNGAYSSTEGYDLVTGLGVPHMATLFTTLVYDTADTGTADATLAPATDCTGTKPDNCRPCPKGPGGCVLY